MIIIIITLIMKYFLSANLQYIPELGALYTKRRRKKRRKKKEKG